MSTITNRPKKIHEGKNVKRFREMLGIKQETLAYELGDDWNQKRISLLESKEKIEDELLAEIARVLKVPAEAIKNFDEETAISNIQNNYDHTVVHAGPTIEDISYAENYKCNFNPLDKVFEQLEEIKGLYAEKETLWARLLESEKEKVEILKSK